jgi:hypothetical protein
VLLLIKVLVGHRWDDGLIVQVERLQRMMQQRWCPRLERLMSRRRRQRRRGSGHCGSFQQSPKSLLLMTFSFCHGEPILWFEAQVLGLFACTVGAHYQ